MSFDIELQTQANLTQVPEKKKERKKERAPHVSHQLTFVNSVVSTPASLSAVT